jgi:hypothetical protein
MQAPYDSVEAKNRVYTFVMKKNALYRGSSLVQSNVSSHLPSAPSRSYSTIAARYLHKAVKYMI